MGDNGLPIGLAILISAVIIGALTFAGIVTMAVINATIE
jgi:hypothetical protein